MNKQEALDEIAAAAKIPRQARLYRANLSGVDLSGVDLRGANLYESDLRGANLRGANLYGAKLYRAKLRGVGLYRANRYQAALPAPTMVLLAEWGICSDELTTDLMLYDASNHENPLAFDTWADGGSCPFAHVGYQRSANFREDKKLWPGWDPTRVKSAYQLMCALINEKCCNKETQ